MNRTTHILLARALFLCLTCLGPITPAGESIERSGQTAVNRALNFLARDAAAWRSEHDCSSCHHASMIVWAMNEAKGRNYVVDETMLADLTLWLTEAGEGKTSIPRPEGIPKALNTKAVYYALGLGSIPNPGAREREALRRLLQTVKSDQLDDGSWAAWPETRPPMFEPADEVMTQLATLAAMSGVNAGDATMKPIRDRGVEWLARHEKDPETQALALRLIILSQSGLPSDESKNRLIKRIQDRQNPDGGWSQVIDGESDAWATGQTLFALAQAKVSPTNAMVSRARGFLIQTQTPGGSWKMKSRPNKPGDSGAKNLMPITGAAAAWGVLGLVRSER